MRHYWPARLGRQENLSAHSSRSPPRTTATPHVAQIAPSLRTRSTGIFSDATTISAT